LANSSGTETGKFGKTVGPLKNGDSPKAWQGFFPGKERNGLRQRMERYAGATNDLMQGKQNEEI
jgi:hypothetical protein